MRSSRPVTIRAAVLVFAAAGASACLARAGATAVPPPVVDLPLASETGEASAVLAGGCFWGIEAVFEHVRGVIRATSGYAGGTAETAQYDIVSGGRTGHAEAVEVVYDPSQITYGQLLHVFFSVAHDPTELNRQGPDVGPQYRSAIFPASADQARIARAYISQLNRAAAFRRTVVTEVTALPRFYHAEPEHQDYAARHPTAPYIVMHDAPKVERLRQAFPDRYVAR
jgi:peptide-methionine (S)-S-oxide reductase